MNKLEESNKELFLKSFNNDVNEGASVVDVKGNVILGFIGVCGYAVFEPDRVGNLKNVNSFGDLKNAIKEFDRRKDQTGMMDICTKISMIKNEDVKNLASSCVENLKAQLVGMEKWRAISAKVNLEHLESASLAEIIEEAETHIRAVKTHEKEMENFVEVK